MSEKGDAEPRAPEDLAARERIRYQWMLDSVSKFRFFFAGLVFAMLSFSVQFAIQTTDRVAIWCQAQIIWISFVLAVMLLGAARVVSDGALNFWLEPAR